MDTETYSNEDVAKYLNENFVSVKVNTDEDKELPKKFKVRGIPDTLFLDAQETVLLRIVGHDTRFLSQVKSLGEVTAAEKKVAEKPDDIPTLLEAADVYLKLERWEPAGRLCEKALLADPEDKQKRRVEALYKLGLTHYSSDQVEEAETAWKEAGARDPDNKTGYIDDIQFARAEKQAKEQDNLAATKSLQNFIERYPESERIPDAKFLLGTAQFFSEDVNEAIKTWKDLVEKHAGTPAAKKAEKSLKFAEKKKQK